MKTMYVMLPCYNEAQNIGQLLEEWEKQRSQLETEKIKLKINVINDASTDNTKDIVLENNKFNINATNIFLSVFIFPPNYFA